MTTPTTRPDHPDLACDLVHEFVEHEPITPPPPPGASPEAAGAFDPGPALAPRILDALADPHRSLASVADEFGTTLAALALWMARPDISARLAAVEAASLRRARLAAAGCLRAAALALAALIDAHRRELEAEDLDRREAASEVLARRARAREGTRKAAHLLLRLARLTPPPSEQASGSESGRSQGAEPARNPPAAGQPTPGGAPSPAHGPASAPLAASDLSPGASSEPERSTSAAVLEGSPGAGTLQSLTANRLSIPRHPPPRCGGSGCRATGPLRVH